MRVAAFEDLKLVFQTHNNLENLRRDMRANAQAYLGANTALKPVTAIAQVMTDDALEYVRRLEWQRRVWDDLAIRAKIASGLTALGLTATELQAIYTELRTAAESQRDAGKADRTQIASVSNAVLANVAAHESVY